VMGKLGAGTRNSIPDSTKLDKISVKVLIKISSDFRWKDS